MNHNRNNHGGQILGRVKRDEFIGRSAELERLVSHAERLNGRASSGEARGLLILLAPLAGVSELLRQTFDTLFNRRAEVLPIYFALPQAETTAVSAAIEFLNTFLVQYIANRSDEPALCHASLTLNDLVKLAPSADVAWIEELIEVYNQQRFGEDDREFVRFCLTAPNRIPTQDFRPFVVLDAVTRAGSSSESLAVMRLDQLGEEDARLLITSTAQRQQVSINDETRDLLVQQLEGSPFFITAMLQAAAERHLSLDSYFACERLYVDELMGGRLNRYFSSVLEHVAPEPETRAAVIRLLCEAAPEGKRTAQFEGWRR